jgi:hypothetical protein
MLPAREDVIGRGAGATSASPGSGAAAIHAVSRASLIDAPAKRLDMR